MDKLTGSLMRLAAAFPRDHVPESTITLYRSKLSGLNLDVVATVIEEAIVGSKSFPTIAELREACLAAMRQERSTYEALPLGREAPPPEVRELIAKLQEPFDRRAAELEEA